ncbi:MAG: beta-1,6-N-acetylglucosaminyltransferase [Pelatocladus maniniholoensis HA4357-MV3]|jgi:hypothetical protein|uniref:Peptide O-xylosyltransferase n=1 Tax=Pelatocladus maniniholoensis HA4357-MV3 TaxID=1117104 RepID=A0A9E3H7Q9_9NOST|nr:beta-1,6-N-acetylglucosaminyltransferase [Pelatocladus maniniholoensis HA4357-MV3]BAZ68438.1 putative glycosyl transferase [Fischerella sp. NIES-4106]
MKIAYIILAHKYPKQLLRLINRLNTDDVSFFIHIDKKADSQFFHQLVTQLQDLPNVYFLKRYDSAWGSFNIVRATLEGIKLIAEASNDFDHIVNLSGQDYLIKSNEQIQFFFEANKGKEFLEYFPLPCSKWRGGGFRRVEYWHIRWKDEYLCLPEERKFKSPLNSFLYSLLIPVLFKKRKLDKYFPLYGGSQFWCLTGECVKWINDFVKQNRKFVNRFNYTFCTDEIFFQTLILNSPFKDKVVNEHLRYVEWSNINDYHPKILTRKDFEKIKQSKKIFARKFDMTRDEDILNMIDKIILDK